MNITHFLPKTMAAACVCLACGCSTVKTTAAKIGNASRDSIAKILPSRIPVVEVRKKDLRDMPLGSERALAYEKKKQHGFFSFFTGPVDFEEPDLPDIESEMTGSLLPPKSE